MMTRLPEPSAAPTPESIEAWLRDVVAHVAGVSASAVDVRAPLSRFGIDSATSLIMAEMLMEWLRLDLEPTILREHRTIEALVRYLEPMLREPTSAARNS